MSPAAEAWERAKDLAVRFPIVRDLRQQQLEWDYLAAADPDPMPCARPAPASAAIGIGLVLLGMILGTLATAMLP